MFVTVAICTWNRAALLDQTLLRLVGLQVPQGVEWEVLVVNNRCSDSTEDVVNKHSVAGELPLRSIYEGQPGQSHARNCAIDAARGDYIIWTDDDVLVDQDWLARYADAFRTWPSAAFFGGPIHPWYEGVPPRWIQDVLWDCKHLWAVLDLGNETRPFQIEESPFGANMAIRTDIQRVNRFDPCRGHVAGQFAGGDETTLIARLQASGHVGIWVADAKVKHFIPLDRMSISYLRNRAKQYGYQDYDPTQVHSGRWVFGLPGYVFRQFWRHTLLKRLYPFISSRTWALATYHSSRWAGVIQRIRESRAASV